MGLDMYLSAKRFIWFNEDELTQKIRDLGIPGIDKLEPKQIDCTAIYWRKANHIHHWFVENVQDGKDECEEHWVGREELQKLLADCAFVKANPDKAADVLPPSSGFFFGATEIGDWYWEDIDLTIQRLEILLNDPAFEKGWDFYYRSSW